MVRGRIWPNFKLIQPHVCRLQRIPSRTIEKSGNTVFQIIHVTLSVAMGTSGRIWLNFELIHAFMHDLIACKYEKDQMKKKRRKCDDVFFSIISLWEFFQTLKGSQLRSPWSDLAEFLTNASSCVYHRYLQV